jgi:hypothetical protein
METVWMRHPNLPGQEIEVPKSAANTHAHSGWVLLEAPPEVVRPEDSSLAILNAMTADDKTPDTESTPSSDDSSSEPDEQSEPTGAKRTRRAPAKKEDDQ